MGMINRTVTAPDGTQITVNVPEDASEDDVFEFASQAMQSRQSAPVPYGPGSGMNDAAAPNQPQQEEDYSFSPLNMVKNIPQSGANLGWQMYDAISNPVDTLNNMGKLGYGVAAKAIPGRQGYEDYADAAGKSIVERYGDITRALKTLESDPLGVMADASGFASGTGMALRGVPGMSRAGRALQVAGEAVDPLNAGKSIVSTAAGATAPVLGPEALYAGAAKYGTTPDIEKRQRVVRTGLDERLPPTVEGMDRAKLVTTALEDMVGLMINEADASGQKIPARRLVRYIKEARDQFRGTIEGSADIKRIDETLEAFKDHIIDEGMEYLSPSQVQKIKRQAYTRLSYDKPSARTREATEVAQKGIARAAKEELENIDPAIKPTNERLGNLYEWAEESKRPANRIENLNIAGVQVPMNAIAGGVAGGSTGSATGAAIGSSIGALLGILDRPKVKARVAIWMNDLKKAADATGDYRPITTAIRNLATQGGRLNQMSEEEIERLLEGSVE